MKHPHAGASEYAYFLHPSATNSKDILAFAHRGGAGLWPENTVLACKNALLLGCRYLEIDLQLTRDCQLVVFHDVGLERTTDGRGRLDVQPYDALRRLDAAFKFAPDRDFPLRGRGVAIPTLEELIEIDSDVRFNIDLKSRRFDVAAALWRLIEKHGLHDRILVGCAHIEAIHHFRKLSGGTVATSACFDECLRFLLAVKLRSTRWLATPFQALQIPRQWKGIRVISERFIESAHAHDLHVHVWTVDDLSTMQEILGMGADGIMSDRPDRLLPLVFRQEVNHVD